MLKRATMGKNKNKKGKRRTSGLGRAAAATTKKFSAPTQGLEDVYFTWGTAKDAAKFEETVSALARHVGTQPWKHSLLASKAMSSLSEPVIAEPDRPVREYWTDGTQTAKTNNAVSDDTPPVPLVPVKEDWDHDIDVDDYKSKRKSFRERKEAWEENRAKCYYLVLSHCPKELETELRNSSKWTAAEEEQDVIALLLMVRDITHNKKERKESVMTIVESDVELYTTVQEKDQDLDDYYKVFRAQVDTIDAHGGNAGYHPVVYQLHLAALRKKKEISDDAWETASQDDKKAVTAEALKTSKQAYLACLFLLMADDERYSDVKATLDDNYLLGKQEYPQDLLAAKRLLADFKGNGTPKTQGSNKGGRRSRHIC